MSRPGRPVSRALAPAVLLGVAVALLVALLATGERWRVERQQRRVVLAQANELDRQLAQLAIVPRLLAEDPRIVAALAGDGARADAVVGRAAAVAVGDGVPDDGLARRRDAANAVLEGARAASGAAFVFLMDLGGTTVAASNWREPLSFVGANYGFRPYFRGAVAGRETTFFAVGATTGEPGYFVARPVRRGGRVRGVVVVKVSLEALMEAWRERPHRSLVTDELGVVILSSDPELLYRSATPLAADAHARLAADRRYVPLEGDTLRLPLDASATATARLDGRRQLLVSRPLAGEPWALHLLLPERRLVARAALAATAVAGVALIGLLLLRLFRQQRRIAASEQRAARELERLVASRTEALERAQRALIAESNFAMLGRMSAAINHEINQPLASLRLDLATLRALTATSDPPLEEIRQTVVDGDRTTRRIARVIETLRNVARQRGGTTRALDAGRLLDDVVATVRRERPAAARGLVVHRPAPAPLVRGDPVLLQQALLNLVHNAFDAIADADATVAIERTDEIANERAGEDEEADEEANEDETAYERAGGETDEASGRDPAGHRTARVRVALEPPTEGAMAVRFVVEDDGPGIDPAVARQLFEPFASSHARTGGLGLGLTLARQIAADHDGELVHVPCEAGTRFELRLPLAADRPTEGEEGD